MGPTAFITLHGKPVTLDAGLSLYYPIILLDIEETMDKPSLTFDPGFLSVLRFHTLDNIGAFLIIPMIDKERK